MNKTGVFLGRISPLHKGHQLIIDSVIADNGMGNSLILVGSSNVYNERTPFTYDARKHMAGLLYPELKVEAFPDVNPELNNYEEKTLPRWISNLKELEKSKNTEFLFYGGSEKDIDYLKNDFDVKIALDRNELDYPISASIVREILDKKDYASLKSFLDVRILDFVISEYAKFKE